MTLQREQLDGLAEPHVVGQAGAEPERGQERQPRHAPLLVRPQRRLQARGSGQRFQRALRGAVEQVAQPAVRPHGGDRQRGLDVAAAHGQHVGRGRRVRATAAQEVQAAGQCVGVHRHPLAAHPHQRRLRRHQRGDLLLAQLLVADRDRPAETGQLVAPEPAAGDHARRRGGARGQPQPDRARPVPPGRELDPEPGRDEHRRVADQEAVRAVDVQVERRRAGPAQRRDQRRQHLRRPPQLGQQQLLRAVDQPLRGAGPHVVGVELQARVLGGAQRELQLPAGAVAGLVLRVRIRIRRVVQRAHLGEPEHRARRAGWLGADLVPPGQRVGQLAGRLGVPGDRSVLAGQRGQPRLGVRRGRAGAPGRDQLQRFGGVREPLPDGRVGEHGQRGVDELARVVSRDVPGPALLGPPDRRQRLHQRRAGHLVEPLHDRTPPGPGLRPGHVERRQHPPACDQLVGQAQHRRQVPHGVPVPHVRRRVEQLRRVHDHGRHAPRGERRRRPRAHLTGRADQAGGVVRAARV